MILPILIIVSIQTEEATKGEPSFISIRMVFSDSFTAATLTTFEVGSVVRVVTTRMIITYNAFLFSIAPKQWSCSFVQTRFVSTARCDGVK